MANEDKTPTAVAVTSAVGVYSAVSNFYLVKFIHIPK